MPRMSKATARKRLDEARMKCFKVYAECDHLTDADYRKILDIQRDLRKMAMKLKK